MQSRESAQELMRFLSHNFMNQYVDQPTRGSHILDLFCANNPGLVQSMAGVPSELSDHSMVSALVSIPVAELDGLRSTRAPVCRIPRTIATAVGVQRWCTPTPLRHRRRLKWPMKHALQRWRALFRAFAQRFGVNRQFRYALQRRRSNHLLST